MDFNRKAGSHSTKETRIANRLNSIVNRQQTLQKHKYELVHNGKKYEMDKEEVVAAQVLKMLTAKYGTRGKSAKSSFLKSFENELREMKRGADIKEPKLKIYKSDESDEECIDSSYAEEIYDSQFPTYLKEGPPPPLKLGREEQIKRSYELHYPLGALMSRPKVKVDTSVFIKRLHNQIHQDMKRIGCPPYKTQMSWFDDKVRELQTNADLDKRKKTGVGLMDDLSEENVGKDVTETAWERIKRLRTVKEPISKKLGRHRLYRRAFLLMMHHFESLRPIFMEIYMAYELVLKLRERQIAEVNQAKKAILPLQRQIDERDIDLRREGYKTLSAARAQNYVLVDHVLYQKKMIQMMKEILEKTENCLKEEQDLRRAADDYRKLLLVDINDYRRKYGIDDRQEEHRNKDDPLQLRKTLEEKRSMVTEKLKYMDTFELKYSDTVPREEYEAVKAEADKVTAENNKNKAKLDTVMAEGQAKKDKIDKLLGKLTTLKTKIKNLQLKPTPRPSWTNLVEKIGGLQQLKSLKEGKSTEEVIDDVVENFTGGPFVRVGEYINGLGDNENIPRYLQYSGRIMFRNFSRRDCIVYLQDIWNARNESLELLKRYNEGRDAESSGIPFSSGPNALEIPTERPAVGDVETFFIDYFSARYHIPLMRYEHIYNLLEGCRVWGKDDKRLSNFLAILQGRMDENVCHAFRSQITTLRDTLLRKSQETNQPAGSLLFASFTKAVEEAFPNKSPENVQSLVAVAQKQLRIFTDDVVIKYIAFFVQTDEGLTGDFMLELTNQFEEERLKYVYEILSQVLGEVGVPLSVVEREDDPAGDTDVEISELYTAFLAVDPTIPDTKLGQALAWVFMGVSSLPGNPPKGVHLVEYIRIKLKHASEDQNEDNEASPDDEEFENAIHDILAVDDEEDQDEDAIAPKAKKIKVKNLRIQNLRNVVKKCKGGAFFRHGPRNPDDLRSSAESQVALGLDSTGKTATPPPFPEPKVKIDSKPNERPEFSTKKKFSENFVKELAPNFEPNFQKKVKSKASKSRSVVLIEKAV